MVGLALQLNGHDSLLPVVAAGASLVLLGLALFAVIVVSIVPAVMLRSAASERFPEPMLTLVGTLAANHLKHS